MRQLKITNKITQRDSVSLDKYLNDIGKIELIDAKQEVELARRAKTGDTQALNQLAKANLRFVISVAKQYQHQGLSLDDLINEGNLGLIKAAKRFDETKGFKFISYAVWWIRQSILQAIVEQSRMVRLPLNKSGSHYKLNEAVKSFMQVHEREPNLSELAELLEMPEKAVKKLLRLSDRHLSMDAPLGGEAGESMTMLDTLCCADEDLPEAKLMGESMYTELYGELNKLSERQATILKAYYGLGGHQPRTLEEIGAICGLTRERVRQIKERALRRLRKSTNSNTLKGYLN